MTSQPKISVIVPVYKAETYLHRCIDSLLAQTFTDFEILLIDDGSPDRSGEMCDEYAAKDNRVRVFHKQNGGVSSARQCGIDNALGEYTIHADPDDWVDETMLEALYYKARKEEADMVICDFYISRKGEADVLVRQRPTFLDSQSVVCELFQQLHGSCCNKLVKRACYSEFGVKFPTGINFCEDLYVNTSLLLHPIKVSYLPRAFYHYVQDVNPNSIVSHLGPDDFIYCCNLYRHFVKLTDAASCADICRHSIGYLIVQRAFLGNYFNNKVFAANCKRFSSDVYAKSHASFGWKSLLWLSCQGLYRFCFIVYTALKAVSHINLRQNIFNQHTII